MLNTKVMDRTLIILDILQPVQQPVRENSGGTCSAEVPPEQINWTWQIHVPSGWWNRYPWTGRKKLEIDRRLINDRIAQLNRELKEVVKHREIARAKESAMQFRLWQLSDIQMPEIHPPESSDGRRGFRGG